ncbi:MAG: hypothetical protein ACYTG1_04640 [Planctomycetota bacterium]|jgi:hypothetical protein
MTTRTAPSPATLAGLARAAVVTLLVALPGATGAAPPDAADDPLAATLAAHGGLERWREQRTFTYLLDGFPLTPQVARPHRSTVDLRNRLNRIEAEGFTVGWDGRQAWSHPGPDAVGLPPRFFALGSFYFIGMPFVFADEGVILEAGETATFDGRSYRTVRVGYDRGTGHSSGDEYVLFIDHETDRLALINHSVTETGVERVTWVFDEWQEVDGLLVPARITFHPGWNPDDPGDGATTVVRDVAFDRAAPDPALYAPPADAVIDAGDGGA